MYTSLVFSLFGSCVGESGSILISDFAWFSLIFGFVDRRPWDFWSRCPFTVAFSTEMYFAAFFAVRPGHPRKNLFVIACTHVDFGGDPQTAW